jgi:hypothetical protein
MVAGVLLTFVAADAHAQHADVLVLVVDGRLVTGNAEPDSGEWTLGRRVYPTEVDSFASVNNPGFNALVANSASLPAGATALPGGAALGWDFLPMKIDGVLQNAFYWDGLGSTEQEVEFGGLPNPDYRLQLWADDIVGVDGSPIVVPGAIINNTGPDGSLHTHHTFYIDSDINLEAISTPVDGIYLLSMRMTMVGLDHSQPIYIVLGTPGSTFAALQAAETWLTNRVDDLAPDFNADFNDDYIVDGADFLIWQRNLGATDALLSAGDADRDGVVGAGDLAVWQEEFGLSLETFPGAQSTSQTSMATHAVPEPSALALAACGMAVLLKAAGSAGGRTTK